MPIRLRWGVVSITGNFRQNNEDRVAIHPQGRYFVVADGMGGQAAGEKASELATDLVPKRLNQTLTFANDPPEKVAASINDAISYANSEILALGQIEPQFHSMGTTVALIVPIGSTFYVAGVGDSRVYRLRSGELQQLTKDDSLSQALLDAQTITPEEAAVHRYKHVLVKYLGSKEADSGTIPKSIPSTSGDRFFVCSDGVTDGLSDKLLLPLLAAGHDPQAVAESIVKAAQEGGSKDNISCVVIFVE